MKVLVWCCFDHHGTMEFSPLCTRWRDGDPLALYDVVVHFWGIPPAAWSRRISWTFWDENWVVCDRGTVKRPRWCHSSVLTEKWLRHRFKNSRHIYIYINSILQKDELVNWRSRYHLDGIFWCLYVCLSGIRLHHHQFRMLDCLVRSSGPDDVGRQM